MSHNSAPMSQSSAPMSQNSAPMSQSSAPMSQNSAPMSQNSAPMSQNSAPITIFAPVWCVTVSYICESIHVLIINFIIIDSLSSRPFCLQAQGRQLLLIKDKQLLVTLSFTKVNFVSNHQVNAHLRGTFISLIPIADTTPFLWRILKRHQLTVTSLYGWHYFVTPGASVHMHDITAWLDHMR